MFFETLEVKTEAEGQVAFLTINRPQAMNALNSQVLKELGQTLSYLEEDPKLRVLIITGSGDRAFVAGADIKEMENFNESEALAMAQKGQNLFNRLQNFSKPTIAMVNGFALGGGLELALSCDFIVTSEKAKFGLPEVSLGLIPGYGGTQRLSRVVGKAWARRLTLSGEMLSAQKAVEIGLATEMFPPEALRQACLTLASSISARAPEAMKLAKQSVNEGYEVDLVKGLAIEADLFSKTFATEDHKEGIKAFLEKRTPKFIGK